MLDINRKYKNNIEDQVSIRNIIDIQFQHTKVFYLGLSICYFGGFIIPFWLQMFFLSDEDQNLICLVVCLVTLLALNGLQFLKTYLIGWKEYYGRPSAWFVNDMLLEREAPTKNFPGIARCTAAHGSLPRAAFVGVSAGTERLFYVLRLH